MNCVAIIPAFNNAGTIGGVIASVKEYIDDLIVVNDGSTDGTRELLERRKDIRLISYARNKGKGHALRMAMAAARQAGYRYAISIDADGQHYADDLPVFLSRMEEAPDSLLIGARDLRSENMPSGNTFANRFSNFWFKVETGKTLRDTQSGFRLYPLSRLEGIRLFTGRYEFEVEIIVRAAWRGVKVENVPIKVYYPPAGERVSHFRPFRDFARISLLNAVLVLAALLVYYPWRFLKALNRRNIREFLDRQLIHSKESNWRLACAMGWGVFCGIIPIWGYQMLFAVVSAHFFKLNKIVALVFSNISVPPMIPVILYGSMAVGASLFRTELDLTFAEITFEKVMLSLSQYIAGSIVLALVSGLAVSLAGYLLLTIFKRKA